MFVTVCVFCCNDSIVEILRSTFQDKIFNCLLYYVFQPPAGEIQEKYAKTKASTAYFLFFYFTDQINWYLVVQKKKTKNHIKIHSDKVAF